MLLLVGLGNPGRDHAGNRHNVGFMAADEIVRRHGLALPRARSRPGGMFSEGRIAGEQVIVLKPLTWMNLSGQAVGEAMRYWKLGPADVTVIHDDLDLAPGKVRIKRGGGHGGHNGLRSIDAHIGPDYRRVRVGIGHPGDRDAVTGWVLRDFAKADRVWLDKTLDAIAEATPLLVCGDDAGFMSRVALLARPPRPKRPPPGEATGGTEDSRKTDES
jgi:PTH1 family peptidyl-tRNA hydrolase